jgi:uncharacterized protein
VQSNLMPSNPSQSNPVQSNPLQSNPVQSYEVQYVLHAPADALDRLRKTLVGLGESISVASATTEEHIVHLHTADAGAAVEAGLAHGRLAGIRVTGLPAVSAPTADHLADPHPGPESVTARGDTAVVAIAQGEGVARLFGTEQVRVIPLAATGGPDGFGALTVELVTEALLDTGARRVVLLANSVEPAAVSVVEAAAARARAQGIGVAVVPTRSAVQGLAAVAVHDPLRRFDDDVIAMAEAAAATRVAQVCIAEQESITYAGRCQAGDVLGLIDGEVVEIGSDFGRVGTALVRRLIAAGGELVTVLSGQDARSVDAAATVAGYVRTRHPLVEVSLLEGGQLNFPLLIGVE